VVDYLNMIMNLQVHKGQVILIDYMTINISRRNQLGIQTQSNKQTFGITNSDSTRTNKQVSDKYITLQLYTSITAAQCICMAANG